MKIQIVYPDDGWILNKLADLLINNLDCVTGTPWQADTTQRWDITYYVNYYLFKPEHTLRGLFQTTPNSRISGAFFTHREGPKYDKRARHLDFCICPCQISCDQAMKFNRKSYLVYHGINLDRFKPKLTLGFIGKINTNGRKGEDLFDLLKNLPFVNLKVTNGTIAEDQMPQFYHSIDYVFIPSIVEGGPLCFQEGLASGKEIISSDVGMVHDFKGAEGIYIFDRSNPQSLITILEELFQKKMNLRRHIEAYNEQYFIRKHLEIFKLFANNQEVR